MIETICNKCGSKKTFNDDKLGKIFKCHECGNMVVIKNSEPEQNGFNIKEEANSQSPISKSHNLLKFNKRNIVIGGILIVAGLLTWGGIILFKQHAKNKLYNSIIIAKDQKRRDSIRQITAVKEQNKKDSISNLNAQTLKEQKAKEIIINEEFAKQQKVKENFLKANKVTKVGQISEKELIDTTKKIIPCNIQNYIVKNNILTFINSGDCNDLKLILSDNQNGKQWDPYPIKGSSFNFNDIESLTPDHQYNYKVSNSEGSAVLCSDIFTFEICNEINGSTISENKYISWHVDGCSSSKTLKYNIKISSTDKHNKNYSITLTSSSTSPNNKLDISKIFPPISMSSEEVKEKIPGYFSVQIFLDGAMSKNYIYIQKIKLLSCNSPYAFDFSQATKNVFVKGKFQ